MSRGEARMPAHGATRGGALRQFVARATVAGLESAVLLCLILIAILAESGLLGGALAMLP